MSRSAITSCAIAVSMIFCRIAQANDSALKQILLMFPGIPSVNSMMIARAWEVSNGPPT